MKKVLSIDLNSKNALVGVINQYGEIEDKTMIENDPDNLINNLAVKTKTWLEKLNYNYNFDIERIGLAVPGFIDHYNGIVRMSQALNWKDYNLKKEAKRVFNNKKVFVLNRANAMALGEFWIGSATDYNSELFYNLGARITGAIVMNGKLILGEEGFAGEFGHGILAHQAQEIAELNPYLDSTSSVNSFVLLFSNALKNNPQHHSVQKYFNLEQVLDLETILKVYHKYHRPIEIKSLIKEILKPFIAHISIMISALDPKSIVIAGKTISSYGSDLLEIVSEELQPLIPDFKRESLILKTSALGTNAGIIGAAYFAMNNWYEN